MKISLKRIALCVWAILCFSPSFASLSWDGSSSVWTAGSGTVSDPYLIESPAQLAFLSEMVAGGVADYSGVCFLQTADFSMSGTAHLFTPVGVDAARPFRGSYDGGGHSLSSLKLVVSNGHAEGALFGFTDGASISNLTIESVAFSGSPAYAAAFVARVIGPTTIANCVSNASFTTSYAQYAGGIVAHASAPLTVRRCANSGAIIGNAPTWQDHAWGGLVGCSEASLTLTASSNTGAVSMRFSTTTSASLPISLSIGGLVGYISNTTASSIIESYNTGALTCSSQFVYTDHLATHYLGGLIGYDASDALTPTSLLRCFSVATLSSTQTKQSTAVFRGSEHVAGLLGFADHTEVSYCYARGSFTASRADACGLAFATASARISNAYFAGLLTAPVKYGVSNAGQVVNTYFNDDCGAPTSAPLGMAKTVSAMQSVSFPIILNAPDTAFYTDDYQRNAGFPVFLYQNGAIYMIAATASEGGTVTGDGEYQVGSTVTLTAVPDPGYAFTSWTDGSTENPRIFPATADCSFIARFRRTAFSLTVRQDCTTTVE